MSDDSVAKRYPANPRELILKPLLDYVIELCNKYNRRAGKTFPIMMRIKSVGKMLKISSPMFNIKFNILYWYIPYLTSR